MRVLVFNCGSSSLKFDLLELDTQSCRRKRTIVQGVFAEIGRPGARTTLVGPDGHKVADAAGAPDHASAALMALSWMESVTGGLNQVNVVAHRVVHGGEQVTHPALVNDEVMRALEDASRFAPLHNPPALATIRAVKGKLKGMPEVVVADTAFHQTLPKYAFTYAIPRELTEQYGVRRFGFHGTGHAYMMERYAEIRSVPPEELNLITLHLGAGCSATAIKQGRSVDTSMGLTPLEGLMMGTRSGDVDPAILGYLGHMVHLAPERIERILNYESGLLGVSGISADMREVEAAEARGDQSAALAIDMFCYRVRKYIGSYLAVLGRADAIIFGGGIGEHAQGIRARICEGLQGLGIELDPERNRATNGNEDRISSDSSRMAVHVIPLDEEFYIARAAMRLLS